MEGSSCSIGVPSYGDRVPDTSFLEDSSLKNVCNLVLPILTLGIAIAAIVVGARSLRTRIEPLAGKLLIAFGATSIALLILGSCCQRREDKAIVAGRLNESRSRGFKEGFDQGGEYCLQILNQVDQGDGKPIHAEVGGRFRRQTDLPPAHDVFVE